ncbi:type II toxin-antitoxin system Phd/YefM family antitoxin [uncultured Friedmanniella sp.]|uniref:type II toxin-antitoxin system Phd/YefM family antitoxin n=1 Tax=uncultured Friedmanniella sp. TaxID=335381 RepID=UPI0035CB95BB
MSEATVRDLRNQGGHVLDRVLAGEAVTITRDGEPVAQLIPLRRKPLSAAALVARFRRLPPIDPAGFRRDVDSMIDQSL